MIRAAAARAAAVLLLVAAVAVSARAGGQGRAVVQARSGGDMAVELTRLGKLAPKVEGKGTESIDAVPIVLWAKDGPAAVLAYRKDRNLFGLRLTEDFVDLGPGRGHGVSHHLTIPPNLESDLAVDALDVGATSAGDVDGDGQDELVRVHSFGIVEVFREGKALRTFDALNPAPLEVRYTHRATTRARLPGRDVLLMLFRRQVLGQVPPERLTQLRASEPWALLRVDQGGVARVGLQGLEGAEDVLAVGALSKPGAKDVDELLVVSRREGRAYLSRHRPDGAAIGAPRAVYEPFDAHASTARFCFVGQSARAVLLAPEQHRAYFLTPEKPANWLRAVDLTPLVGDGSAELRWHGTTGAGAELALVVSVGAKVYAVDEEGAYWGPRGGRWSKLAKREPMVEVAGPELHELVGIYPAGSADELLAVHAQHFTSRPLTEKEIDEATERFLPESKAEEIRRQKTINLANVKRFNGKKLAKELAAAKHEGEITTVEELKRFAPSTYAEEEQSRREAYQIAVGIYLLAGLEQAGRAPEGFREPAAYEAWLKGLTVTPSTSFTLLRRGERAAVFQVDGVPPDNSLDLVPGDRIQVRTGNGQVTVVLPLAGTPGGSQPGGFFLLRARSEGR